MRKSGLTEAQIENSAAQAWSLTELGLPFPPQLIKDQLLVYLGKARLSLTRISIDTLPIREYSKSSNSDGSRIPRSYREIAPESTFRRFASCSCVHSKS